jgi:hypothetical protein
MAQREVARVQRTEQEAVNRHFAVYVLPSMVAVGAAIIVRSLALGTWVTALLTVAVILGSAAWVLIAASRFRWLISSPTSDELEDIRLNNHIRCSAGGGNWPERSTSAVQRFRQAIIRTLQALIATTALDLKPTLMVQRDRNMVDRTPS